MSMVAIGFGIVNVMFDPDIADDRAGVVDRVVPQLMRNIPRWDDDITKLK